MSTAGRNEAPAPPASDLAAALADAGFVRLVGSADGDAAAATGLLANALSATGTPFQASILDAIAPAIGATQADYTVAIGDLDVTADAAVTADVAASATAFDVAGELVATADGDDRAVADDDSRGAGPDPILALAGAIAADEVVPSIVEAVETAGVERRPGVAVPVTDLADGLAHSTLFHGPFSGDVEAATRALEDLDLSPDATAEMDADDRRRVASLVALAVSSPDRDGNGEREVAAPATERAAEAVERALHPYAGGPFETVAGYADVLDAVARKRPGVALSLVLGQAGARDEALSAWRTHGESAHAALTGGETARHDGLYVIRAPTMPVATVARLAAQFRSPESVVLAVADGEAAIHAVDGHDAASALRSAVDAVGGTAVGTGERGRARFETGDGNDGDEWTAIGDDVVAAVREAL